MILLDSTLLGWLNEKRKYIQHTNQRNVFLQLINYICSVLAKCTTLRSVFFFFLKLIQNKIMTLLSILFLLKQSLWTQSLAFYKSLRRDSLFIYSRYWCSSSRWHVVYKHSLGLINSFTSTEAFLRQIMRRCGRPLLNRNSRWFKAQRVLKIIP